MKIDHVAMYVQNLEETKAFFVSFFGASANDKYYNPRTGLETYFLTFKDQTRLEIMTRPELVTTENLVFQTGYIHLAFSVGSKELVNKLTKELAEAGYEVLSGPRTTGDGYYESCIIGPEGNLIEIME